MIALLSVFPPPSPRATQARKIFSRRSRRAENCRNGSTLEREIVTTCLPASPRSSAARPRRRAYEIGQAREVVLALEHQRIALLVRQHVLTEGGAERRQPLVDLGEPRLGLCIERRAGALEHQVVAVEHALLLGGEAELVASAMKTVDAAEQRLVHEDAVPVLGLERRERELDRLDGVVGMRAGENAEDAPDPGQRLPAPLQRLDGIGEGRLGRIGGDGVDLGGVRGKCARVSRLEMLRLDPAERRDPEGAGPVLEQRVLGGGFGAKGLVYDLGLLRHISHMGFDLLHCTLKLRSPAGRSLFFNFSDVKEPPPC